MVCYTITVPRYQTSVSIGKVMQFHTTGSGCLGKVHARLGVMSKWRRASPQLSGQVNALYSADFKFDILKFQTEPAVKVTMKTWYTDPNANNPSVEDSNPGRCHNLHAVHTPPAWALPRQVPVMHDYFKLAAACAFLEQRGIGFLLVFSMYYPATHLPFQVPRKVAQDPHTHTWRKIFISEGGRNWVKRAEGTSRAVGTLC